MTEMLTPPAWTAEGVCGQADPELFFPDKGKPSTVAKRICMGCPVRRKCLRWALDTEQQWGVWGGKTAREMRALRKERRLRQAA